MSTRHEDNDGSDIFWPGYVDATTNLILNLLFLLTILMVAVFMFALELGRSSPLEQVKQQDPSVIQEAENRDAAKKGSLAVVTAATTDFSEAVSAATLDLSEALALAVDDSPGAVPDATTGFSAAVSVAVDDFSAAVAAAMDVSAQENAALKQELVRLNNLLTAQLAESEQYGGQTETVDATSFMEKPQKGLDQALASDFEVVVRFMADSIEFTPAEHERLHESLQSITTAGKASIYVEVPAGFSEAKRMGFYRAMAVRNFLIEMDLPQEQIDVKVVEGSNKANAAVVRVRTR